MNKEMNEKILQKAIEGGWYKPVVYIESDALLDPFFWQSLGKALGWTKIYYGEKTVNAVFHEVAWLYHAEKYFETHLTQDPQASEEYLNNLLQ